MTIDEALYELGVRADTLTADEIATLDRDGYLPLPGLLSAEQVAAMNIRLGELVAEEGDAAGSEVHKEVGTDRLSDLVNKGEMFTVCFTHLRVLAAIAHVLRGDLKLSSLNARSALPGAGLQALHVDWSGAVLPDNFRVCNSIWLLDDFTADNGATRVVPGSQLWGRTPRDEMSDTKEPHPQEVVLQAPAGTVVIFNSHTWHGGTRNRSANQRRAIHSYFCRREEQQQLDQRKYLRPETAARMPEAARVVLDVA